MPMVDNASSISVGQISQVNTRAYHRSGLTSVSVSGDAHYASTTEINAGVYNRFEVGAADPLEKLYARVAAGCMHNSAERVDAPKCHEETRKAVQDDIFSWISDGEPDQMLWLTGPAGSGKTAIMGTVSDKLEETGQLAATFYFSSYRGMAETMSKQRVVTTLAYQLIVHPTLKNALSSPMLSVVRQNPAVFDMNLKRQFEMLILQPLRASQGKLSSVPGPPMAIIVDGVDECGEGDYSGSGRSRQDDQIEILSLLLQAIKTPSFPFRIVVASRPETWIRRFLTDAGAGVVTEIFLDDKYSPDDDIRLFLQSKFAELCRRYGINPVGWPTEEAYQKLVQSASGQFIYVATVLRFVDTPGRLPQDQLDIVLRIKPQDVSSPFSALDALYTSILQSSPAPETTVLWLNAQPGARISVWTVDRLFESTAGQAQMFLGLPSLVYIPDLNTGTTDSSHYGARLKVSRALVPDLVWDTGYAFYHRSFLDYLGDRSRCGAAFPNIGNAEIEKWIWGRFSQTLKCGGPEVQLESSLLPVFKRCFLDMISVYGAYHPGWATLEVDAFSMTQPREWIGVLDTIPSRYSRDECLMRILYSFVHQNCRSSRPCNSGCKRWREAISELPSGKWKAGVWSSFDLFLDRFCLKDLEL